MIPRPLSVTIISWILIVLALLGLVGTLVSMNVPEAREIMEQGKLPVEAQIALSLVGLGVLVVSGIGMLKGGNWARMLYVGWTALSLILGFFTAPAPATMIPSLIIFLIIAFFLFRPAPNAYFRGAPAVPDAESP